MNIFLDSVIAKKRFRNNAAGGRFELLQIARLRHLFGNNTDGEIGIIQGNQRSGDAELQEGIAEAGDVDA